MRQRVSEKWCQAPFDRSLALLLAPFEMVPATRNAGAGASARVALRGWVAGQTNGATTTYRPHGRVVVAPFV